MLCGAFHEIPPEQSKRFIREETIAFFPEAIFSSPNPRYLDTSYIDVPWEEPELVIELMRRDWRDRGLLARLYRAVRPPKKTAVVFAGVAAGGARRWESLRVFRGEARGQREQLPRPGRLKEGCGDR